MMKFIRDLISSPVMLFPIIAIIIVAEQQQVVNESKDAESKRHFLIESEYVFPQGCPDKDWIYGDEIPAACNISQYSIENSHYGLPKKLKGHRWLRYKNDALDVTCFRTNTKCLFNGRVIGGFSPKSSFSTENGQS